ncbi:DUF481 domain-containing protein [Mucilaginibacter polytrichastri]|uniref:DUF481 domain-containing protein n=1 Tax=Mucilaginibacter polytrichastri TaxID=1302689 RepID=A0A1Q6A0T5_9SPHI|nr:DUF481 domain-containing protein [Mucilaginibacter polytrichastri]OKS87625.1 hypothetical protein RG47T_3086 [Mucilaginibacter polytrichastri]SFS92988.1 Protein of unknown function, DUF481 [Mucilaginibacter polytrichastri]
MKCKHFLLPLFILITHHCLAQFNDTTHYYTNFSSAGSINKTDQTSTYLLNNSFKFGIKKKTFAMNFNNNWIYGKADHIISNNDFATSLDFNLLRNDSARFYYWGLANYTTSVSLKINNQLQAGTGGAYYIVNKKNTVFNISDGILFDRGDLFLDDGTHDVYSTYRNSFRVFFKFVIKDLIVFDGSDFIQNSLTRRSDYIIRSTTNLSVKLRKWLSFTTSYNYNRMNRTARENSLLSYGLTAEKYF